MSASVLATGRAFSSQRAREISSRAGCRQASRARARIQQNTRAHPARYQNSDRACTHSVGFMHARVDGWPRMRSYGLDCQDGTGCPICLRSLLTANSSARGASDHWPPRALEFVTQRFLKNIEQLAPSVSLRSWEKYSMHVRRCAGTSEERSGLNQPTNPPGFRFFRPNPAFVSFFQ